MDVEQDEDVLEKGSFGMMDRVSEEGGRLARLSLEDLDREFSSRREGGERLGESAEESRRGSGMRGGHDDED